ncbi:MAG: peptidylprolyl isomerase [Polynucleobacter sp.]|jgi:peptidyl-prolyl cis-trans isomerase C|nr:peptidylprolyl isomerase [Polynucleobacter sp.]
MSFKKYLALGIASFISIYFISPVLAQNAAIVNGKPIPSSQLDTLLKKSGQPLDNPQIREQGREMLITRELLNQEAAKRGITEKPEVKDQLDQARIGVIVGAVFEDYVQREGVTDADLKSAYDSLKTQFSGKEYKVRHILVEKEADAKSIIAKIKAGAKFEDMAKANSKDTGSADKGGNLDWISDKALVPEFSKVMVSLKKGQMTDKPVKTQFGWHIIQVEDIRDAQIPPMDQIKDQLKQMITSDQAWQKEKFSEMMKKIRDKAKIE